MTERPLCTPWIPAAEASKNPATENHVPECQKSPHTAERDSTDCMVVYEKVCTGTVDLWIFIVGQKKTIQQNEAVHTLSNIKIP